MTGDKHRQGIGQLYRELPDLWVRLAEAEANARWRRDKATEELERCKLLRAEVDCLVKTSKLLGGDLHQGAERQRGVSGRQHGAGADHPACGAPAVEAG